jgi:preprotein translocase subunit SecF
MFIIKNKKIFIGISVALVLFSIISISVFGLKIGIDFKGGALTEVVYTDVRPEQSVLNEKVGALNFGTFLIQPTGDKGYLVKTRDLTDEEHDVLLKTLSLDKENYVEEVAFNSIGPSVGRELTRKAILAIILVAITIICFIAYAFRKVSKPVSSWRYGLIAIVSLLHDIIIPVGIFSWLSFYLGAEVDTLFVVALLTVLGLSVSDTIVIFDRIRENLHNEQNISKADFSVVVGKSLNQSFVRSISTSLSTILVLVALFFFGPETTKYFALILISGMFFGTYSSIFLASPLLVVVAGLQKSR